MPTYNLIKHSKHFLTRLLVYETITEKSIVIQQQTQNLLNL